MELQRRRLLKVAGVIGVSTAIAGCTTGLGTSTPSPSPTPDPRAVFVAGQRGASSVDNDLLDERLASYETGDLSDEERADVLFMREEEKLAHDVYAVLSDEWGLQVHENIEASEQSHMDAMLSLVETYDLEDPSTGTLGTFTNDELQVLYDELIEWGTQSAMDALKVGCRIEDKDMRDINAAIERTDERAAEFVYENLVRGSRNHLRAFYRVLTRRGGDYEPVYISQEAFEEIVESDWETGKSQ